jgi:hypothetical protein
MTREVSSLEENNLVAFYYLSASEIWLDRRAACGGRGLIRWRAACGGRGLIRWRAACGGRGLIKCTIQ